MLKYLINRFKSLPENQRYFILFSFLSLGVVFYLFVSSRYTQPTPPPAPSPKLVSTSPSVQGEQEFHFLNESLTFTFNQVIDLSQAKVTINPDVSFQPKLSSDSKSLIIIPTENWKYDQKYQVTISGITSEPISFHFMPLKPDYSKPMGIPAEKAR